jgi:hypothetical protein
MCRFFSFREGETTVPPPCGAVFLYVLRDKGEFPLKTSISLINKA